MHKSYFITAIDTDAGKSVATGLLAKYLLEKNTNAITQKMAQTGCAGISEDIETHRKIMGVPLFPEDISGTTCSYVFPFPAAPRLSAKLVGETIKLEKIHLDTTELEKRYNCVLTEGVGGIMVPVTDNATVLDYMKRYPQPTLLVTNGKLGSINHTLLSLEALKSAGIEVVGMIYNNHIETDPVITKDSLDTLNEFLKKYYPQAVFIEISAWKAGDPTPDFSALFEI